MKRILYFILAFAFGHLNAQIVINEVSPTNNKYFEDEDGSYPDWIEIYNDGAGAVNLSGYSLKDDNALGTNWVFPDTVLPASQRLIVYASGKNRNCLSCPVSPVDHWETAIFDEDIWEYKNGTTEPPSNWNDVTFTAIWSTASGGFGSGDGDDNTILTGSAYYYRKEFDIVDKSKIIKTILSMDYDDGYVVYINDVEVARMNITGTPTHNTYANYWHEALMYQGYRPKTIELDSTLIASLLIDGENVLAVEIHQYGADDGTGRTWLHFGISTSDVFFYDNPEWFSNPGTAPDLHANFKIANGETISLFNNSGVLIDSILVDQLQVNNSRARIPDGGNWCYSDEATPGAANVGTCYSGYATAPVIITTPGFYVGGVDVEVAGTDVYYTTDGSIPDVLDDAYITPVHFSSTGVIKAVQTETGKLPSPVVTGSYLIDEPTVLPVVSISAEPCDLFNEGPDCIAAYDKAEGWFNLNPIVPVTVEYYGTDRIQKFVNNFKFECVGNFSISLDQKSMRFVNDEDYGSGAEDTYNLFAHDKPELDFIHGFRVRNMDQDYWGTRMKDITINRIGLPTRSISTAYQNVAVFINGEYWGMYGAREEMDEYFLRDNYGVNPDKVDLMKTGWGGEEKTIAEAGSDTAFYKLVDFITSNDMSDPSNYDYVATEIDVDNWVDYVAVETFTDNQEWMQILENNIRVFRSYAPDIKWSYMLWDCTNSQFSSNDNCLQGSLNNPNNSMYMDMFNALLENETFHDYFINRFADLINYVFTEENNDAIIDELKAEMGTEIPAQHSRWFTGSYATWNSNVNSLYTFYDNRNNNQRNHIETYFNLDDQVDITLEVNPPGAGYIKISTIIPANLPWTGVYFDGVPVTVSAIPNPGFEFVDWEVNAFIDDPLQITFTNNFTSSTTFTANFNGTAIANPIVISEINYNSDASINAFDWIEIHNTSGSEINISDYTFSNKYFYSDYKFPLNTVIGANEFLVIGENVDSFLVQHPGVTNVIGNFHFSLENDQDSILLKDFQNNILKTFNYYDFRPWPFTADGYGRTMEIVSDVANPALAASWFEGCVGGSPGEAFSPCNEDPIVDEINYNSAVAEDAGDWFELNNMSASSFDISNWKLKDKKGNVFIIPPGTIIPAEGFIVFFQDGAKFTEQFPFVTNKVGPVDFGFDGNGDVILIYQPDGKLFQSVGFDDAAPYPLAPDGGGYTLQIENPVLNLNDPLNWITACPEGSPGTEVVEPCATGIDDNDILTGISVYPNPVFDILNIQLGENLSGNSALNIYDLNGREIINETDIDNNLIQVNLDALVSGIYFIKLTTGAEIFTSSFVKE
ncbi:MAG: lamin tail domain-containing protein [Chitinophagales bacterium]